MRVKRLKDDFTSVDVDGGFRVECDTVENGLEIFWKEFSGKRDFVGMARHGGCKEKSRTGRGITGKWRGGGCFRRFIVNSYRAPCSPSSMSDYTSYKARADAGP